jgi:hypothetical protein
LQPFVQEHLARFEPPCTWCEAPTPLSSVLNKYSPNDENYLYLSKSQMERATQEGRSHIVTKGYPNGARSPTSSYGSPHTPGTMICINPKFDHITKPLAVAQLRELGFGNVRKLHPDEILSSFSFTKKERPRFMQTLNIQYNFVAQSKANGFRTNASGRSSLLRSP